MAERSAVDRTFPVARVSSLLDREERRMRADPPEPLAVLKSLDREQDDIHRAARTAAVSLGDLVELWRGAWAGVGK